MTVCESCNQPCNGLGPFCDDCENEINIYECSNDCGETVYLGGFCSVECKKEYIETYGDET